MYSKEETREEIYRLIKEGGENAWFNLIEMPDSVLPELVEVYRSETDPGLRELLVEVIWQHRQHDSLDFLGEALRDPNERVWIQALDGLVAIGGDKAIRILEGAIADAESVGNKAQDYLEWVTEALDQVVNGDFGTGPGAGSAIAPTP